MADYTLSVDVTANDHASETLKKIQDNAKNFKSTVENAGQSMQKFGENSESVGKNLTKSVTTPIVGVGAATAKLATDFGSSMAKVSTIADTTQVPIGDLKESILELSDDTGVAASDIAESAYQAISAGQSTGEAVNFVTSSTKLAKGGFTDAATSVDTLTTILNAYGDKAGDVTSVSDKLIMTQNLGKTTVDQLGASMGKIIPTANMYGVSLDNITSAYVTTTKNGIATAESTTYLNSMLNELGKAGTDVSDMLKEKTGKSFQELMESGMSLTDVLGIVQEACTESGKSIGDVFSSQEAAKGAATLVQHADDFNSAMQSMANSAGATNEAFNKIDSSNAENFAKALNRLKNAGIQFGEAVVPVVVPVFTELVSVVKGAADAFNSLPEPMQDMIVKGLAIAAAVGPVVTVFGKVTAVAGKVTSGFGSIAGKLGGLGSAASSASVPVSSAGAATGSLAKNALGLIAAGAGILLASAGLALLAYSAIQLAQAGPTAILTMVGMVAAIALLAVGAAALAPALTAGAAGLLAFGAAILMVGAGVALACAGVALLATQLPTISEYGQSAAVGIIALGVALMSFASGATMAGAGALILGVGLLVAGAGALTAAAGVTLLAVGVVALGASLTASAGGSTLLAAALLAVSAEMVVISATANSASNDLKSMVKSIDIVDTGINGLKKVASSGLEAIASAFTAATPSVTAKSTTMSLKMADSVHKGFAKVPTYIMATMTMANAVTLAQFVAINATVSGQMNRMTNTVRTSLNQMKNAFASTRFKLNTNMALPHFSMSGNFNAQTKAVPKVHVSWYAKAYDEAMMFNTPQVVQANGFGDGPGNEVVSGDRHLVELFKEALGSYGGGDTIIPVYLGQERIDELVVTAKQRKDFRSGGR